jgi:hypothetical protein
MLCIEVGLRETPAGRRHRALEQRLGRLGAADSDDRAEALHQGARRFHVGAQHQALDHDDRIRGPAERDQAGCRATAGPEWSERAAAARHARDARREGDRAGTGSASRQHSGRNASCSPRRGPGSGTAPPGGAGPASEGRQRRGAKCVRGSACPLPEFRARARRCLLHGTGVRGGS